MFVLEDLNDLLEVFEAWLTGLMFLDVFWFLEDVDVRLRVSAIYSLRREDMPQSAGNEILQALMAVFDNYQEHYR